MPGQWHRPRRRRRRWQAPAHCLMQRRSRLLPAAPFAAASWPPQMMMGRRSTLASTKQCTARGGGWVGRQARGEGAVCGRQRGEPRSPLWQRHSMHAAAPARCALRIGRLGAPSDRKVEPARLSSSRCQSASQLPSTMPMAAQVAACWQSNRARMAAPAVGSLIVPVCCGVCARVGWRGAQSSDDSSRQALDGTHRQWRPAAWRHGHARPTRPASRRGRGLRREGGSAMLRAPAAHGGGGNEEKAGHLQLPSPSTSRTSCVVQPGRQLITPSCGCAVCGRCGRNVWRQSAL